MCKVNGLMMRIKLNVRDDKAIYMYSSLQIYDLLGVDCLVKVVWRSNLSVFGEQFVTTISTTTTLQSLVPCSVSGTY